MEMPHQAAASITSILRFKINHLNMKNSKNPVSFIRPLITSKSLLFTAVTFFIITLVFEPCSGQQRGDVAPRVPVNAFPVCTQFSPVPSGEGWRNENTPLTDQLLHGTIHEIIRHGFSVLSVYGLTGEGDRYDQAMKQVRYAASLGMKINYMAHGAELFSRENPSPVSVYSPLYVKEVRKKVQLNLAPIKEIDNLHSIFTFQDEPFHAHPESFDYHEETKAEFLKRYGYPMPPNLDAVQKDPVKWLDFLNFQSDIYRDGWLQVYDIVKEYDPRPKIIMTHDSHNTYGAGVKSNSLVGMDDVFHWGGDFADLYIYDIYPYMTLDFRYGDFSRFPKPRISQMHYTISQLRNLTTTYKKELGYWVGTYNKAWYKEFMGPERKNTYWSERELSTTAVAQGADFLITGFKIPEDEQHWEALGQSLKILQKAGPGLMEAPKVKANACFLFPRTQYLQLQEEYFNVGLSFELFLRAFGELDIIHEEQITDNTLNGYKMLVLCDVKLLPAGVAEHIESFVRNGGIVVADCVPQMDEYKRPMDDMKKLFGVKRAATDRVVQEGHWVRYATQDQEMHFPPSADQEKPVIPLDSIADHAFGQAYGFKVFGPRVCELKDGKTLLELKSGKPALVSNNTGQGKTYLLGFSLQDTYFQTWKDDNTAARGQLRDLLGNIFEEANVHSHIHSSNPDIEATVRANASEGYVFIINHETDEAQTKVRLNGLKFSVGAVEDIGSGASIKLKQEGDVTEFLVDAPLGTIRILRILPETK